jgi:GTP-binding protein
MFVDQVNIVVQAGKGGDGCMSFRREKYVPLGGPDGADGGKGADVVLQANPNLTTLFDLRYKRFTKGEDGQNGKRSDMTGRSGKDLVIQVPVGTLVKDEETGGLLADLKEPFQSFLVAKGGRGGRGNTHFKSSVNRAPRKFETGHPGEQFSLSLELKLLADVGIIGFPNAGKSTLISRISNARPKVGDYPFTTLTPQLGVVCMGDYYSFVAADIPGLIEGAHQGKGLGIQFLKHTERTRLLLHLLDFSAEDNNDPVDKYHKLQNELKCFSEDLFSKPQILVASKMDQPEARERFSACEAELKKCNALVYPVSSVTGEGIDDLLWKVKEILLQEEEDEKNETPEDS